MRFDAVLKIFDGNPYVFVSKARARRLKTGWKKTLPVRVRIDGEPKAKPWRINMMPIGDGSFRLYLHGDVRKASRTKVGDRVASEARERNVEKALRVLSGKRERYMARSWSGGR